MHLENSPAWVQVRKSHLANWPVCVVCKTSENLHVHHLRYRGRKRGEAEEPEDLMTLCKFHHDDLHKKFKSSNRPWGQLWVFSHRYVASKFHAEEVKLNKGTPTPKKSRKKKGRPQSQSKKMKAVWNQSSFRNLEANQAEYEPEDYKPSYAPSYEIVEKFKDKYR